MGSGFLKQRTRFLSPNCPAGLGPSFSAPFGPFLELSGMVLVYKNVLAIFVKFVFLLDLTLLI